MSDYSPFQPWSDASPYALALGLSALFCILLAVAGWRRRRQPGGLYFTMLMAAAADGLLGAVRAALDSHAAKHLQVRRHPGEE